MLGGHNGTVGQRVTVNTAHRRGTAHVGGSQWNGGTEGYSEYSSQKGYRSCWGVTMERWDRGSQ